MGSREQFSYATRWTQVAVVACVLMLGLCIRVALAPSPKHWFFVVVPALVLALLTVILSSIQAPSESSELSWLAGIAAVYIVGAVLFGDCANWLKVDQVGLALFSVATGLLGMVLPQVAVDAPNPGDG